MTDKKRLQTFVMMFLIICALNLITASEIVFSQIETSDYKISKEKIEVGLEAREIVEEKILIENLKGRLMAISFSIDGDIDPLIELDKEKIMIDANSNDEIILRFFGDEDFIDENTTEKNLIGDLVLSGDIDEKIPIELTLYETKPKTMLAFLVEIEPTQNSVNRGSEFKYQLNLHNLLPDSTYDVTLSYFIDRVGNDSTNNNSIRDTQKLTMSESFSLLKRVEIPDEFELGDYMLNVEAQYLDYVSITSTMFSVKIPFYKYALFGIMPLWAVFVMILIFIVVFIVYKKIKKSQEKNKRFHAKFDEKAVPHEGDRSLWMGSIAESKQKAYIDMDKLTVHSIFAGSTGAGKTTGAQVLAEEALMKGVSIIIFDPTAQWSDMLRKCEDKKMLEHYAKFGLKPSDAKAFNGNVKAIKNGKEIINLNKYLKPGEIQIFALNELDAKGMDTFISNSIKEVFRSNLHEVRQLTTLFIFDEIHMILPKFGGTGAGFVQIERACREFRKWGIGIILISQVLADFMGQIKANINTEFLLRTRDESDLDRIKMKYGQEFIQELIKAPIGAGMLQNAAWNKGQPYYVEIRPTLHGTERISDADLAKYNKYNEIVDDLEYQFEQLEKLKQDVFDLKLELKLSKDKIKSGNFNMVQIYLDGLTPRVKKVWDKIGQKPKKLELKLIDDSELAGDLAKAKEAMERYAKDAKAAAGA